MDQIVASAARSDVIIIAWGKAGDTSKGIQGRQKQVLEQLSLHMEKLYAIGFHPLSPRMKSRWNFKKLDPGL